jgi:hypothetical protein
VLESGSTPIFNITGPHEVYKTGKQDHDGLAILQVLPRVARSSGITKGRVGVQGHCVLFAGPYRFVATWVKFGIANTVFDENENKVHMLIGQNLISSSS